LGDISPVFKLAALVEQYSQRLQQLGIVASVLSTRLRAVARPLSSYRTSNQGCGRDVILAFQDGIGAAISKACAADCYQDSQHLAEAAEIVRRDIFAANCHFTGTFSSSCQNDSVPESLLALISLILEGASTDVQSCKPQVPAALSIAQLIIFNSVKHRRTSDTRVSQEVHHSRNQEMPLPLYIGLEIHAATRKRSLVESLFEFILP